MTRLIPLLLACLLLSSGCELLQGRRESTLQPGVVWTHHLMTSRDLTADYIGDNILIASSASSLDWVDIRNGSVIHSVSDPSMYSNGLMWFASPDGQVFYRIRDDNARYDRNGNRIQQGQTLSSRDSRGQLLWEISMPGDEQLISTAIGEDRIFLILGNGHVMAVARDGSVLWYRDLQAVRLTGFAALVSRQLVYLNRDGYLCVADVDGNPVWQSDEQMGSFSATLELPDGSLVLYDFPLALRYFSGSGELLWKQYFAEYEPGRGRLSGGSNVTQYNVDRMIDALPGNGCVVAHPDGRLSAISAEGRILWRSVATDRAQLICSDERGNVYASVVGEDLYAFDSQGKLAWQLDRLGPISSAPSVDGLGHVYVETDTDLFCLDPKIPDPS